MKINLYKLDQFKIDEDLSTYDYFKNVLVNGSHPHKFLYVGESAVYDEFLFDLFIQRKQRVKPPWLDDFSNIFKFFNNEINMGEIYNGILTIRQKETTEDVYVISFGYSYNIVQKYCDFNFAMDFAERQLSTDKVTSQITDYIQNIRIRSLLNIKKDFIAPQDGGESFKYVKGVPKDEQIYGSSIECGYSIRFSKSFSIENISDLKELATLIREVETTLSLTNVENKFPRISYLNKSDTQNIELDQIILETLRSEHNDSSEIELYMSDFDVIGTNILFNDNTSSYKLYIKNKSYTHNSAISTLSKKEISIFINNNINVINELNAIRISVIKNNEVFYNTAVKNFLFAVIDQPDSKYILSSGRWGKANATFINSLDDTLIQLSERHLTISNKMSISYTCEDNYIEELVKSDELVKLHRKMIYATDNYPHEKSHKFELADLYDLSLDRLFSIKLGNKYPPIIYAFDQANTAVKALLYQKEYNLLQQLKDNGIDDQCIEKISKCKNYSVLIGFEQKYIIESIDDGSFKLNTPNSFLFKLKVLSSIKYITDQGIDFIIYAIPGIRS